MSAHTPGPWVFERYIGPDRPCVTTVAHCCDFVIGLASSYPGGNYRDGDPSGDPEADARLIAAAPDLLAALQSLYLAAPTSIDCDGFHHSASETHRLTEECRPAAAYLAALKAARAAIQKAEGTT